MALDKLTIIDGGGLSTTSDYRVGVITATKFVGPVEGSITATDATFSGNVSIAGTLTYEDVTNVDSVGIITARNGIKVSTGTATTALVVDGDARVTGILTVGTSSLKLDGPNNLVNVGTALTLGHTQGVQFHTQNLHSAGFEVNQINASGIVTASSASVATNITLGGDIIHSGDDTKIRFPSNDIISFEVAGTEKLNLTGSRLSLGTNIRVNDYISHQSNDSLGVKFYNASGNNKYVGIGAEDDGTSTGGQTFKIMRQGSAVTRLLIDSSGNLKFDGADFIINDAIEHNHDPNTKIRFPANDTITAETNGAERLRITSGGSVNIGSANGVLTQTTFKSQIETGTNKLISFGDAEGSQSDKGSAIIFSRPSNGAEKICAIFQHTNQSLGIAARDNFTVSTGGNAFYYSTTERLRITSDGKLGVGDFSSTSVAQQLHVRGSEPKIYLEHTGGYDMTLTTSDGMGMNGITVNGGFLSLAYNNKNIVMCRTGGSVGINSTSPREKLDVSGGRVILDQGYQLTWASGTTNRARIHGDSGSNFIVEIGSSNSERLRITSDGQLKLPSRAAESTNGSAPDHFVINRSDSTGPLISMGAHTYAQSTSNPGAVISANHRDFIITKFKPDFSGNSPGFWLRDNYISMFAGSSERLRINSSGNVKLPDNGEIQLGGAVNSGSGDLRIVHNGTHSYIHAATGGLYMKVGNGEFLNRAGTQVIAKFLEGTGGVELNYNNSKKFHTTNTGVEVTGNIVSNHSNGQVSLATSDGAIELTRTAGGAYIDFKDSTSEDYDIRINEEGGAFRVNTHFRLYDNKALELGNRTSSTYGDLRLYHDTSNSIIENFTGSLNIRNYDTNSTNINISARNNILLQTNLNETAIQCIANGAVEIFHDSGTYGTAKLQTTTTGIKINGTGLALNVDGGYIRSVGGQPTVVAHKSSSTFCHIGVEGNTNARAFLAYTNDKDFIIGRRTAYTGDHTGYSGRDISIDKTNHAVELCYNGGTRFATTSTGIQVTGDIGCTSDLILDSTNTDHPRIEMHSNATGITKYAILNGQTWNPDALLIYDLDADNTRLTIESSGLGINRGANSISHGLDVGGTAIIRGTTEITGTLILPTTDAGITFGAGSAANDRAHMEWKGGDNAGYLRISVEDDSDTTGANEYIEFGDYATQNRGGAFTQHCRISRDQFLIKTGAQSGTSDRFKVEEGGATTIYSSLNLQDELNMTIGGNKNRFIDASMANNEALFLRSTQGGDTGHQNMALFHRNGSVNLYHANTEKFATQAHGINVYGDIHMGGTSNTGTNQNRQIYWTGFDKEASGDNSDFAHIKHTTNIHGIAGSVLEIKAENDANDGIALAASGGAGQIAFVGKKVNVTGYLQPSYGSGDNGIKWPTDPAGGSGDVATIQYYADGSGENTRLRILIGNDGDDDLRLEGSGGVFSQGTFSASTKNFRIPHVLTGLTTTTDLVHSTVEGPQADNLYRGRTKLVAGISTVNIDTTNNMTEGTFVNLNRDVQCFTTNETGWTAVKGSVTGNLLTIIAQDNTCTDTISWMVIGERWDLAMYDPLNSMTDENGKIKTEVPNRNYAKGYNQDYIRENKFRVGISTISRPSIENKEVE